MVLKIDGRGVEHEKERFKAQTDLFYLSVEYLGWDLVESVHRPVCDFFVHKNPGKPFEEQSDIHDRLLLDPREHYKTTIDSCDIIQWIICFPTLRVYLSSGTQRLVKQIVRLVTNQFQFNNKFKELFPEHAIGEYDEVGAMEWTTPARKVALERLGRQPFKEPTLWATTIESGNTGGHYEIMKFDDIVTPDNVTNEEQIEKVKDRVAEAIPLVVVGGYRDFVGTRYDFADQYGSSIDKMEQPVLVEEIPFGTIKRNADWQVFERKVCTMPLKETSQFLFPTHKNGKPNFNYKELKKRIREMGAQKFGCQYLNDPKWGDENSFADDLLESRTLPMQTVPLYVKEPMTGQLYRGIEINMCWDFAYSQDKQADFTACAVGGWDKIGRLWIVDGVIGKYSPDTLVNTILELWVKWKRWMGRILIEESGGARLIEPALKAMGFPTWTIDWEKTTPKKEKNEHILSTLPLLKQGRLLFVKEIPCLVEGMKQYSRWRPTGGYKDDFPDAVAKHMKYQPTVPTLQQIQQQSQMMELEAMQYVEPSVVGYGLVS